MVYLIAMISALTGFLFGFDEGIMSGVLEEIKSDFFMNDKQTGFMMGLLPFGALLSASISGWFSDRLGRLGVLFLIPLLFCSAILVILFTSSYQLLCLGRLLLGISIGMSVVVAPLYIAETAPSEIRGKLLSYFQLAITLGILCAYILNLMAAEYWPWRWMFALGLIPGICLFIGAFFLPESPRWLCAKGRIDQAHYVLGLMYHTPNKVEKAFKEIQATIQKNRAIETIKETFSKNVRPCIALGVLLFFFQQLSGINVIIYYAPIVFKHMHLGSHAVTLLATVGIGVVNVLFTVLALRWVEKMGRRPLLMLGFIGTAIALFVIAFLTYLNIPELRWLSMFAVFFYIAAFAVSLGPLPWVMMPEIFPLKARGLGASMSAGSNWLFNTIVVSTFPIFLQDFGISWTFILYAVACVVGFLFAVRYMPETKHISLEKIEEHIHSGKPLRTLGRGTHL